MSEVIKRPKIKYILKSMRTGHEAIAINILECPLTYYHHRKYIEDHQYDAGMKFRDVFEAASISNRAIDFDNVFGVTEKRDLTPQQAEALHELRRLMRSTNKIGRAILIACCAEGVTAAEFERRMGWRQRYGLMRLKEALDDIAEALGFIHRRVLNN